MPKYRARVECFNLPPADTRNQSSRLQGETFTNIVQHISSSGADLGIEMIAANFGVNGTGLGFWDSATPVGIRSWACFRFHSASLGKFDCLVFAVTGSSSINYGAPIVHADNFGTNNNSNAYPWNDLLISFACHPSGSNLTQTDGPWNGTYSLTSASIGNPVWKVTPAGKGAFFPRQNGIGGAASGSRGAMTGIFPYAQDTTTGLGRKLSIITSEDSLTIFADHDNNDNYSVMHFGSYTPRSGVLAESPYFFIRGGAETSAAAPLQFYGSVYGTAAYTNNASFDGAIAHPDLFSGSRTFSLTGVGAMSDLSFVFNKYINNGIYEKNRAFVVINEGPTDYGVLGTANHIAFSRGMANRSVSTLSASVAIGTSTVDQIKLILPWSGSAPSLTPTIQQAGVNWSLDI